jgi:hypothetical protein
VTGRARILVASALTTAGVILVGGAVTVGRGAVPAAGGQPLAAMTAPSSAPSHAVVAAPAAASARVADYLLVLDFLPGIAEDVEVDPIAGHPDSDALVPILGEPTEFGAAVDAESDANGGLTRCGVVGRPIVEGLARALNGRVADDQRIDPAAPETRTLLHWSAAEGFASVRIFARDATSSPSCDRVAGLS